MQTIERLKSLKKVLYIREKRKKKEVGDLIYRKLKKEMETKHEQKINSLRNRWIDKTDLINEIIKRIKKNENWTEQIKNVQFSDEVKRDLRGITLKDTDLSFSDLNGIDFEGAKFINVNFTYSNLDSVNFCGADLKEADLRCAKNINKLIINKDTDFGIDFAHFIAKRKRVLKRKLFIWRWFIRYFGYKGKIHSEIKSYDKKTYEESMFVYNDLCNLYKNFGSGYADYFSYRRFSCEQKSLHSKLNPLYWIGFVWEKATCAGTSPFRFLIFILFTVLFFGILYYFIIPNGGIIRVVTTENGNAIKCFQNYWQACYFSIVTFSSLGYGDFHPNHDMKIAILIYIVCGIEIILGIFSIGIIASIFIRFMMSP